MNWLSSAAFFCPAATSSYRLLLLTMTTMAPMMLSQFIPHFASSYDDPSLSWSLMAAPRASNRKSSLLLRLNTNWRKDAGRQQMADGKRAFVDGAWRLTADELSNKTTPCRRDYRALIGLWRIRIGVTALRGPVTGFGTTRGGVRAAVIGDWPNSAYRSCSNLPMRACSCWRRLFASPSDHCFHSISFIQKLIATASNQTNSRIS